MVKRSNAGRIEIELRNRIFEGDDIEVLSPTALGMHFIARNIRDAENNAVNAATRPSEIYSMDCCTPVNEGDLLRIRIPN